jgi:hypothetical protein
MSSYTDEEDEILCDGFKSLVITPDDDSTTCTLNETFSHSDASGHSCEVQSLWRCDICEEYRSYDYEDVVRHEETCTAFAIDRNSDDGSEDETENDASKEESIYRSADIMICTVCKTYMTVDREKMARHEKICAADGFVMNEGSSCETDSTNIDSDGDSSSGSSEEESSFYTSRFKEISSDETDDSETESGSYSAEQCESSRGDDSESDLDDDDSVSSISSNESNVSLLSTKSNTYKSYY